ncbi:MAG: hypothetical protein ACXV3U_04740 [Halobacteriota archaeon]
MTRILKSGADSPASVNDVLIQVGIVKRVNINFLGVRVPDFKQTPIFATSRISGQRL